MAKEFDIYLKRHLTECDLIVYSIPYYDGLTVTDRLIIDAALNGYILQKFAAVQMGSELTAHIDDMIKLCLEKLDMKTVLGATAEIEVHNNIFLKNEPIILDSSDVKMLEHIMNEVENKLILAVEPLETQIAKSIGQADMPLIANVRLTDILKRGFLAPETELLPMAELEQINQVDYIDVNAPAILDSTLESLCYQLTFNARAAVEISALVLGTEIRHSLGRWYNSLMIDSRVKKTWAQKFITAKTVVEIMQEATGTLIKVLYPENEGIIFNALDLNTAMKRYRLLNEMDDLTLAELDDQTLDELDYVWLIDE